MAGFTAHNIILPDGTQTLPGAPVIADEPECILLRELLAGTDVRTVADLGCLEGGHSVMLARAGYDVTGIEARDCNMVNLRFVQNVLDLPNLRFVQDDVRNLAAYGPFDAVFCSGLLYHMDEPVALLKLIGEITEKIVIVQTHWSVGREENEGKHGHWYQDFPGEADPWGSYGNARSFWLGLPDILSALNEAGFTEADYVGETTMPGRGVRGMFTGIK